MASRVSRYKVAIVAPTCFYYQVPIFKELARNPRLDLTVYYCSSEALYSQDVTQMYNTTGQWGMDDELLEGYQYKFLKNHSPTPSYLKWPFGLMNLGIWNEIRKAKPHVVILMSWVNVTWWVSILASLQFRTPFFYMTDANDHNELDRPKWKRWFKRLFLDKFLFRLPTGFLYSGTTNRLLYQRYGVPDEKLFPFVYSWGYKTLLEAAEQIKSRRSEIRKELGIPEESYVILYCGRLSPEKGIFDLFQAYARVKSPNKALLLVGDGRLRQSLTQYAAENQLESIYFCGFQRREDLPKFYSIADVLVLPSWQEPWGMVVNEALCFGLPAIVSDQVGAGVDLVMPDVNGNIFPRRDVAALADHITRFMEMLPAQKAAMANSSRGIMEKWLQQDPAEALVHHLDEIYSKQDAR